MIINMDLDQFHAISFDEIQWVPSPGGQVKRKMLERNGAESGWATTIVTFPPGSSFPHHEHPGGEEYLVLQGDFKDAVSPGPAGTYVRNPPGTSHQPWSDQGCVLFVKLCQMFNGGERLETQINNSPGQHQLFGEENGEQVWIKHFAAHESQTFENVELLLIDGEIRLEDKIYPNWSWFRLPQGDGRRLTFTKPSRVWLKEGGPRAPQP